MILLKSIGEEYGIGRRGFSHLTAVDIGPKRDIPSMRSPANV